MESHVIFYILLKARVLLYGILSAWIYLALDGFHIPVYRRRGEGPFQLFSIILHAASGNGI